MKLGFLLLLLVVNAYSSILLTEIMYNTRTYDDYFEYIEIYNSGSSSVDLSGWAFKGITFQFPSGTKIAPGAYYVVSVDPEHLLQVYESLSSSITFGPFNGSLNNGGESISLFDSSNDVVFSVKYSDNWSILADGLGSSLELMCYTALNLSNPLYWAASPLPESLDMAVEYGGSPGEPGRWLSCLEEPIPTAPIYFSEIMYHPYKETGYEEMHEYIELYNNGTDTVDLSMWRIICDNNGMRFTFPMGVSLAPGNLLVVAKDTTSFLSVYNQIKKPQLYGGYTGNLPNKASLLAIIDNNGLVVDSINYDIQGSFPFAADALGGNNDSLPSDSPFVVPVSGTTYYQIPSSYVYKGQALARRSWAWGTDHGYNWYATNPSPGLSNLDTSGEPLLPILSKTWTTPSGLQLINNTHVTVSFNLRPWPVSGSLSSLSPNVSLITMTWFVDDLIYTPPSPGPKKTVSMVFNGVDGFNGTIPPQPSNSIVRYKFSISYSDGRQETWPRLQDPLRWYSYFVDPNAPGSNLFDTYHFFLTQDNWETLINNAIVGLNNRRVQGPTDHDNSNCPQDCCEIRLLWQEELPATLVYSGVVYDGLIRLQGSRWNRPEADGVDVEKWGGPGPTGGSLNAYSYRFNLANFQKIGDNNAIILNKAWQGCTFYETPLYNYLADKIGLPSSRTSFARVRFNGYFLRFMMILQHGGDEWIQDAYKIINKRCLNQPTEINVGDVYNSHGLFGYEGPYGAGDFSVLTGNTNCPNWNISDYYEWTYTRFTYPDMDYSNLTNFVTTLNSLTLQNTATKAYINQMLDVHQFLAYYAIDGWAETWDHAIHNQELYMRLSDGKWAWLPWDADSMFGEQTGYTQTTIYLTETSIKNYFTSNFKSEINNYYALLQESVLSVSAMNTLMDQVVAEFNLTEAHASDLWSPFHQDFATCESNIRSFFTSRWNYVNSIVGSYSGNVTTALAYYSCPQKNNVTRVYNTFTSIPGSPSAPIVLYNQTNLTLSVVWSSGNSQGYPIKTFYLISSNDTSTTKRAASGTTTTATTPDSNGSGSLTLSVIPENTYSFSVIAENELGNSSESAVTTIVIPALPPPPPPPAPQPIPAPVITPTTTPTTPPTTPPTTSPTTKVPSVAPSKTPTGTPVVEPVANGNSSDSSISEGSASFWTLPVIIGIAAGGAVLIVVVIVVVVVVVAKSSTPELV